MRLAIIKALGLEPFLTRCIWAIDSVLRKWPWLYWKLAADCEWGYTGPERDNCACPVCSTGREHK